MNAADWSFHSTTVWHSVNSSHYYILTSSESHVPTIHALWAIYRQWRGNSWSILPLYYIPMLWAKAHPPLYITPFLLEKRNYFPPSLITKNVNISSPDLLNHFYHANKDHQNRNWIINHLIISSSCFLTPLEIAQNLSLAQAKNTRLCIINSQRHVTTHIVLTYFEIYM